MGLADKVINCSVCGQEFVFTESQQRQFQKRGFRDPKKCPSCRQKRGRRSRGNGPARERTITIICERCGREAVVPDRPLTPRYIFCRECYDKL
jgi:CxxC-x17-CxxC domain-containing protein